MKALIIILVLVGVSFVGLLIYGESGNQEPKRPCQQFTRDGDDYKVPDNWCPPSIAKATRSLQARFAPGLDLPKPGKVTIPINPQQDNAFSVPAVADPDKHRTAKLTLISGDWAIVEGPGDAKQCLCRPKDSVPAPLRNGACGSNWQEEHSRKRWICQSADKWGTIPIEWMGGQLTFKKGPAAQVEVK
jgi:hypothetical protein